MLNKFQKEVLQILKERRFESEKYSHKKQYIYFKRRDISFICALFGVDTQKAINVMTEVISSIPITNQKHILKFVSKGKLVSDSELICHAKGDNYYLSTSINIYNLFLEYIQSVANEIPPKNIFPILQDKTKREQVQTIINELKEVPAYTCQQRPHPRFRIDLSEWLDATQILKEFNLYYPDLLSENTLSAPVYYSRDHFNKIRDNGNIKKIVSSRNLISALTDLLYDYTLK